MKPHIICFGDSNTHGYCADPTQCNSPEFLRYDEQERWTQRLQTALGDDVLIIEEGLSGRTTVFSDPLHEGLSGLDYIYPCLNTHAPVALLIIMLGTNDTKDRLGVSAPCIALGLRRLIEKAKHTCCWATDQNILIIAPPPIGEGMNTSSVAGTMGTACVEKSRQLAEPYAQVAHDLSCHFLDAATVGAEFNTIDFMHLTPVGHANLADALAKLIPTIL